MQVTNGKEELPAYYDWAFSGPYPNLFHVYNWTIEALLKYRYIKNGPYLDIGCGMGRVSALAYFKHNILIDGIDFSPYGIDVAKKNVPKANFFLNDIWTFDKYNNYKTFIITETLEHLTDDKKLIQLLPKDSMVILSYPSPAWGDKTHLRYCNSIKDLVDWYDDLLKFVEIEALDGFKTYCAVGIVK